MILRQYQSLGFVPEAMVCSFLILVNTMLGYSAYKVLSGRPMILVPDALGMGTLRPAVSDTSYIESFAHEFLSNWSTWNIYTYGYRRQTAVGMMTPAVRSIFTQQSQDMAPLITSLAESQSLTVSNLEVKTLVANIFYKVHYTGTMRIYYGGVGGDPEPASGALLLRAIRPTVVNPLCLEVYGYYIDRNQKENK